MDSTKTTFIKDIANLKGPYTLNVKIIRLWKHIDDKNPGHTLSVEMENKIQANVLQKYVPKFAQFLQEGALITVTNPSLSYRISQFKFGPIPKKLSFYQNAHLEFSKTFTGSSFGFSFIDYQAIISKTAEENISYDILGDVVEVKEMKEVTNAKGEPQHLMEVYLQDAEGLRVTLKLWDSFAHELTEYINNHAPTHRVILILQFGCVKYYGPKRIISFSYYYGTSKLYLNSDIPEINQLRERLYGPSGSQVSSAHTITRTPSVSYDLKTDFLSKTDFKTIDDIICCTEEKSFIVLAEVTGFAEGGSWYYLGCTQCFCKAIPITANDIFSDKDSEQSNKKILYDCKEECKKKGVTIAPRYKMPLQVQDPTGSVTFTMFEAEAKTFLGKPAQYFYDKNTNEGDAEKIADEFNVLVGKTYAFRKEMQKTIPFSGMFCYDYQ